MISGTNLVKVCAYYVRNMAMLEDECDFNTLRT